MKGLLSKVAIAISLIVLVTSNAWTETKKRELFQNKVVQNQKVTKMLEELLEETQLGGLKLLFVVDQYNNNFIPKIITNYERTIDDRSLYFNFREVSNAMIFGTGAGVFFLMFNGLSMKQPLPSWAQVSGFAVSFPGVSLYMEGTNMTQTSIVDKDWLKETSTEDHKMEIEDYEKKLDIHADKTADYFGAALNLDREEHDKFRDAFREELERRFVLRMASQKSSYKDIEIMDIIKKAEIDREDVVKRMYRLREVLDYLSKEKEALKIYNNLPRDLKAIIKCYQELIKEIAKLNIQNNDFFTSQLNEFKDLVEILEAAIEDLDS